MKLQEGKRYVTRSGDVVGPLQRVRQYFAWFGDNCHIDGLWLDNGSCQDEGALTDWLYGPIMREAQ